MYWQRLGELPYKLAVQKICKGNATAFDSLIEDDIIKVIDGMICIDFLNEQLIEFENVSKVNSENARSGWEKRRKEATEMRSHSDGNAIREEKIRKEKIKEDEIIILDELPFGDDFRKAWDEWIKYKKEKRQKLTPKTKEMQLRTLGAKTEREAIGMIAQSITNGWTGLFELKTQKYAKQQIDTPEQQRERIAAFLAAKEARANNSNG